MYSLKKPTSFAIIAVTSALLSASASFAMGTELTQLQAAVEQDLSTLGVSTVNFQNLTMAQVAEIKNIYDGEGSDSAKAAEINAIFGNGGMHLKGMSALYPMKGGQNQLEMAVVNDLASVGITVADPQKLTIAQLSELVALFNSDESDASAKLAAQHILNQ